MKIVEYKNLGDVFFKNIQFDTISSVNEIINDVKNLGDAAVLKYSKQFGDGEAEQLRVTKKEIEEAYKQVDTETLEALTIAINNVKEFAQKQLSCLKNLDTSVSGLSLGHRVIPLESAGCYIPGGNYPLPSTAVMTIVPAKTAGVKRVVACSPKIKPVTIAACDIAGADEIYRAGGVQAIAAMAYGTETIGAVDKIVGPGNRYVTAAKKQVYGDCGIDFLAGPSEVLIIADETSNPQFVAADMLAQCEHDMDARAYLICFSDNFAKNVSEIAEKMLKNLKTRDIASVSFEKSYAVVVNRIEEAIAISDKRAPEHLEICFKNAEKYADSFKNYGSLFIGNYSAEVFGDYCAGTNHTLPTNRVSRYSGGLSVFDFVKIQTYQMAEKMNAQELIPCASKLASVEGLAAHKFAAEVRLV